MQEVYVSTAEVPMRLADVIPAFAAVTCWEFSLIFLVLTWRVRQRSIPYTYSALAFFLGSMVWCALMLQDARERHADLLWYRLHYLCVYGTIAVFVHFLALVTQRPLPRPLTPRRLYAGMALLSLFCLSPSVLRLVPRGTPPLQFDNTTWGLFYPLYVGFPLLLATAACGGAIRALSLGRRRPVRAAETTGASFLLSERDLLWIAWSAAGVLLASAAEFLQQLLFPALNVFLNPRAVATVLFCVATGWALAQAIVRNENRRLRLQQESDSLQALAQARLQATHDMQHQIKNRLAAVELPLRNALRGFQQGTPAGVQQARLAAALEDVRGLFHTLDVMLNVARLAAGEPVHLGPKRAADAVALVERACRLRAEREQERRAGNYGGDGPEWEIISDARLEPPTAFLYPHDLEHVLDVLLDNAVKYSPQGGTVCVRLWNEQRRLRLSVSDEGIGIAQEDLGWIGARAFFRGPAAARQFGGTGLGLYLARRLVEAQGGRLWAESAVGRGSTFHISLPLESAAPPEKV